MLPGQFCISSLSAVNEYVFMVQARGIQIRENMKNIGAQVLEQVVRGAYSLNGTGNKTTIQSQTVWGVLARSRELLTLVQTMDLKLQVSQSN